MSIYSDALEWYVTAFAVWPKEDAKVLPIVLDGWEWECGSDGWFLFKAEGHVVINCKEWATAVVTNPNIIITPEPPEPVKRDVGKHYRWTHKQKITEADVIRGYIVVNMDPYRVCKVWNVGGGPAEHIIKKAGRGVSKGHTELELIAELQSCLDRWKGMVNEDN